MSVLLNLAYRLVRGTDVCMTQVYKYITPLKLLTYLQIHTAILHSNMVANNYYITTLDIVEYHFVLFLSYSMYKIVFYN